MLLCLHFANDDQQFPGHQYHQLPGFGEQPREWVVDRILSHIGRGADAEFEVQWSTGDVTWVPYCDVKHLQALSEYCEALGITHIRQLKDHTPELEAATSGTLATEVKVSVVAVLAPQSTDEMDNKARVLNNVKKAAGLGRTEQQPTTVHCCRTRNPSSYPLHNPTHDMSRAPNQYTADNGVLWRNYTRQFAAWLNNPTRDTYPGNLPEGYYEAY